MVKPGPAQNQTVEEILASIRQAISEDEVKRGVARPRAEPDNVSSLFAEAAADADGDDEPGSDDPQTQDVIDLAIEKALDGVRAELKVGSGQPEAAGDRRAMAGRPDPGAAVQPASRAEPRAHPMSPRNDPRPLLSPRAGAAVSASFDSLARSMTSGNGRKLEEMVEGMLRPMLRSWLDDNLPLLVERLVREEIERVSRGRR